MECGSASANKHLKAQTHTARGLSVRATSNSKHADKHIHAHSLFAVLPLLVKVGWLVETEQQRLTGSNGAAILNDHVYLHTKRVLFPRESCDVWSWYYINDSYVNSQMCFDLQDVSVFGSTIKVKRSSTSQSFLLFSLLAFFFFFDVLLFSMLSHILCQDHWTGLLVLCMMIFDGSVVWVPGIDTALLKKTGSDALHTSQSGKAGTACLASGFVAMKVMNEGRTWFLALSNWRHLLGWTDAMTRMTENAEWRTQLRRHILGKNPCRLESHPLVGVGSG